MNREIKFRVPTHCQNGHFRWMFYTLYRGELKSSWGEAKCTCSTHGLEQGFEPTGNDLQFTGLQDKNGKEIYEGDIVRIRHEEDMHEHEEEGCEKGCTFGDDAWKTIEVKWDSEITGYFFDSEALFGHEYNLPIVTEGYETEIIGNIYENPELLK